MKFFLCAPEILDLDLGVGDYYFFFNKNGHSALEAFVLAWTQNFREKHGSYQKARRNIDSNTYLLNLNYTRFPRSI